MTYQCENMEAFVSDDEGFFLFKNIKFKVHEHITELLAATHAQLVRIEDEIRRATAKHNEFLSELGLPLLPSTAYIPNMMSIVCRSMT